MAPSIEPPLRPPTRGYDFWMRYLRPILAIFGICLVPHQALSDTFLLVHHAALLDGARDIAAYRQETGWEVRMLAVTPPAADADEKQLAWSRHQLQLRIREAYGERETDDGRFVICLLGDADAIPPWRFAQHDLSMVDWRDDTYISDQPYQFMDDADALPDVPLGRIPARVNDDVTAYLAKVRRYEQTGADPAKLRITYVAGEGHYGAMDHVLEQLFREMIRQLVPPSYAIRVTYAKQGSMYCPPPARLTDTVLHELSAGGLLFNYIGHGDITCFDDLHWSGGRTRVLCADDLERLPKAETLRPIALLTCCNAGWFDRPGESRSLAEAMLFSPGGPIAVIAGSRITHPYANVIVQKDITHLLLKTAVATIGELDLRAARSLNDLDREDRQIDALASWVARADGWSSTLTRLRYMHTALYNLLGDPATRIARPSLRIDQVTVEDDTIRGCIPGMATGQVTVSIEAPRGEAARPEDIRPVVGDASQVSEIMTMNYRAVNDPVFVTVAARVRDGCFEMDFPAVQTQGPVVLRLYAEGVTTTGAQVDAAGSGEAFISRAPAIADEQKP